MLKDETLSDFKTEVHDELLYDGVNALTMEYGEIQQEITASKGKIL